VLVLYIEPIGALVAECHELNAQIIFVLLDGLVAHIHRSYTFEMGLILKTHRFQLLFVCRSRYSFCAQQSSQK